MATLRGRLRACRLVGFRIRPAAKRAGSAVARPIAAVKVGQGKVGAVKPPPVAPSA